MSGDELEDPAKISDSWPTPGHAVFGNKRRKLPPLVTGDRQAVLRRFYSLHYGHQSSLVHQRVTAVAEAMLVDAPEEQWNPGHGESGIVVLALLMMACILAELQTAGEYEPHPKLAELWLYLLEMDDDVKDVWTLRYQALVGLP